MGCLLSDSPRLSAPLDETLLLSHRSVVPRLGLLWGVGLIVTLVYGGELSGYFLGDDLSFLFYVAEWTREGELARQLLGEFTSTMLNGAGFFYRPLYIASFAIDYLMWRTNSFGWHLTNLGLHLANALLLGAIVERIAGRSRRPAAIVVGSVAALLFALRPPSPEVVVWLTGRTDSLALLGMLVALHAYLQAHGRWGRWYLLALGGFLFALGSKEAAVTLPGVLASLHLAGVLPRRWQDHEGLRAWSRRLVVGVGPFTLVLLAYFGWRLLLFGTPFKVYLDTPQIQLHDPAWRAVKREALRFFLAPSLQVTPLSILVLLITGVQGLVAALAAWLSRPARRVWVFGVCWLIVSLLPLAQQLSIEPTGEGSRLLYIPGAALAVVLAAPWAALLQDAPGRATRRRLLLGTGIMGSTLLILLWLPFLMALLGPWHEAGRSMRTLTAAIPGRAQAAPEGGYAILMVPDRHGGAPFARNGQGALITPPVQGRPLDARVLVVTPRSLVSFVPDLSPSATLHQPWCWNVAGERFERLFLPDHEPEVWVEVWSAALRSAGCPVLADEMLALGR